MRGWGERPRLTRRHELTLIVALALTLPGGTFRPWRLPRATQDERPNLTRRLELWECLARIVLGCDGPFASKLLPERGIDFDYHDKGRQHEASSQVARQGKSSLTLE